MKQIIKRSIPLCVAAILLAGIFSAFITGCGNDSKKETTEKNGSTVVEDLAGRSVEVIIPAKKVTAIGPGALRLVCYAGAAPEVVGIEAMETQWSTGRPYMYAYPELKDLPVIGQGGPDSTPDAEMLVNVNPDVIFVAYLVDAAKADELQAKTGIPVVVLSYGQLGTFDDEIYESIDLIGVITGNAERAEEVVDYIKDCEADLNERTEDIAEAGKPPVYAGGLGMKGVQGIESTSGEFPPFMAINAKNVVDETGTGGSVMIDKEKLTVWDPDIIFIDESATQVVNDDYAQNQGFYNTLKAVNNGELYGFMPFNYYTTNIDTSIADAYYMGKTIFPGEFEDVDPVEKAGEIYEFLLGVNLYDQMAQDFGGFTKITLGSQ